MCCAKKRIYVWMLIAAATAAVALCSSPRELHAQFLPIRSVGGVAVDVDGVVSNPQVGELKQLQKTWQAGLQQVPEDLQKWNDLRFVSLKQIEAQIAEARQANKPLPESVLFLAGLQRVKFVLVYPEQQDIVLAGPAEGWRVNALGAVVGATTGRPVLTLDDLMVAFRVADSASQTGISCSIDPTPEGMQRLQQVTRQFQPGISPQVAGKQMEEAVGLQTITVTGIPATSHFARVIVAADFRMKRLAMNFEPAPVDGMPSFLTMVKNSRGANNMMPRFWLAPNYEPVRRDEGGLAWELRGQGVRCLTEEGFLNESGQKTSTGKADPVGQKWADTFTEKFEELSHEDSSFGELRNVMDLAVVGALLVKERLNEKSGIELPNIMNDQPLAEFPAPRAVPSQASFVMAGRRPLVSVSGGVQIFPWQVADNTEVSADPGSTRGESTSRGASWYWQK